jgi:hypothetical protein
MIYEYGGSWWNDTDRRKVKNSGKNLSQCSFVHHKSTWTNLGKNPGLCSENPATIHLSHGTVLI